MRDSLKQLFSFVIRDNYTAKTAEYWLFTRLVHLFIECYPRADVPDAPCQEWWGTMRLSMNLEISLFVQSNQRSDSSKSLQRLGENVLKEKKPCNGALWLGPCFIISFQVPAMWSWWEGCWLVFFSSKNKQKNLCLSLQIPVEQSKEYSVRGSSA